MFNVDVKFNGKPFNSKDYANALAKAQMEAMRTAINNKLSPFANEIRSHNGIVNVKVQGSKTSIELDNMPQELVDKIKRVLL